MEVIGDFEESRFGEVVRIKGCWNVSLRENRRRGIEDGE